MTDTSMFVKIGLKGSLAPALEAEYKALQKFRRDNEGLTQTLKTTSVAFAAMAAAGAGLTTVLAKAAGEYQQTNIAFTAMLGSAEKATALLEDLKKFAAATPFNLTELQNYTKGLIASGFAQEDIIDSLRMLGDVASGIGTDKLPQLIYAFKEIKSKGFAMTQDLNQIVGTGFNLAEALGMSNSELREMASEGELTFDLVRQGFENATGAGGRFHGLMEAQSKSLFGVMSNLEDVIGQTSVALGEPLIAPLTNLTQGLTGIAGAVQEFVEQNPAMAEAGANILLIGTASAAAIAGITGIVAALIAFAPIVGPVAVGVGLIGVAIAGMTANAEAGTEEITVFSQESIDSFNRLSGSVEGAGEKFDEFGNLIQVKSEDGEKSLAQMSVEGSLAIQKLAENTEGYSEEMANVLISNAERMRDDSVGALESMKNAQMESLRLLGEQIGATAEDIQTLQDATAESYQEIENTVTDSAARIAELLHQQQTGQITDFKAFQAELANEYKNLAQSSELIQSEHFQELKDIRNRANLDELTQTKEQVVGIIEQAKQKTAELTQLNKNEREASLALLSEGLNSEDEAVRKSAERQAELVDMKFDAQQDIIDRGFSDILDATSDNLNELGLKYDGSNEQIVNKEEFKQQRIKEIMAQGGSDIIQATFQAQNETEALWDTNKVNIITKASELVTGVLTNLQSKKEEMKTAGADGGQGFADGLDSKQAAVLAAAERLASSALSKIAWILDEHSPSKEMAKLGEWAGEGFIEGLLLTIPDAERAAGDLGESSMATLVDKVRSMQPKIEEATDDMIESFKNIFADNGEVMSMIHGWEADGVAGEKIAELANSIDYYSGNMERDLANFAEHSQNQLRKLAEAAEDVQQRINDLNEKYAEQELSDKERLADAIVDQEESISDMQEKQAKIRSEINKEENEERRAEKEQELLELTMNLEKELAAQSANQGLIRQLEEQVSAERKKRTLTDLQLAVERYNRERSDAKEAYEEKLGLLKQEITDIQLQRKQITADMEERNRILQNLYKDDTKNFQDELDNQLEAYTSFYQALITMYQNLKKESAGTGVGAPSSVISGRRATGGSVIEGHTYEVGERGRELFTAPASGYITPNSQLGGGPQTVIVNLQIEGDDVIDLMGDGIVRKFELNNLIR